MNYLYIVYVTLFIEFMRQVHLSHDLVCTDRSRNLWKVVPYLDCVMGLPVLETVIVDTKFVIEDMAFCLSWVILPRLRPISTIKPLLTLSV